MTGRPSKYTDAIVDEICRRLSTGEPLAAICRDEGMPHPTTFRDWADARPELSLRFARAREDGEDALAAECLAIADTTEDRPDCRKVRIDTRLKLLAKFNPKRWGDKLELANNPERPLTPPVIQILGVEPKA